MGCTSSKENANPPSTKHTDDHQQIINDQFRQWLKTHRSQADEFVLNDLRSSGNVTDADLDTYRPIVHKALDIVSERPDIKTTNKLSKLIQKEVAVASPKKISHIIEILKQTAEKLRHGQISLENSNNERSRNGQLTSESNRLENKSGQIPTGDPGIILKEALETARILFYKGKQAAIFANPNGGYDVRILDENDDVLKEDGNLLRSIIVTEVKMRPKPIQSTQRERLVNEREVGDDFRRSIDAALKGLETVYQPNQMSNSENITKSEIVNVKGITTAMISSSPCSSSSVSQSIDVAPLSSTMIHEEHSSHIQERSISNIDEEQQSFSPDQPSTAVDAHNQTITILNSPSHNVTYTEIIRSESRDGEQSRRVKSESYTDQPQQAASLKITTKSEFSTDPSSGEKVMEQSVQVISVKVRNEMTTNNC